MPPVVRPAILAAVALVVWYVAVALLFSSKKVKWYTAFLWGVMLLKNLVRRERNGE